MRQRHTRIATVSFLASFLALAISGCECSSLPPAAQADGSLDGGSLPDSGPLFALQGTCGQGAVFGAWVSDEAPPVASHVVDGRFTGEEWAHVRPIQGLLTDAYLDVEGDYLYVLNDWRVNREGIRPDCFNYFGLYLGSRQIALAVYGDGHVEVDGEEIVAEGGYGFGPSPTNPEPHTIWEFRIPVSGDFDLSVCPKDPTSLGMCEELTEEPSVFAIRRRFGRVMRRRAVGASVRRIPAGGGCGNGEGICEDPLRCVTDARGSFCAVAETCDDGVRNQTESDVDCGGGACGRCAHGATCAVDADCISRACVADRCEPADFACGGGACDVGTEDCLESASTPTCEPLPEGCYDCDCAVAGRPSCSCVEDLPGHLRVTCDFG